MAESNGGEQKSGEQGRRAKAESKGGEQRRCIIFVTKINISNADAAMPATMIDQFAIDLGIMGSGDYSGAAFKSIDSLTDFEVILPRAVFVITMI